MTPEGIVKAEVKAFLDSIGAWHYCPVPMGYGRKGIPDFIGCFRKQFFSIEVKAPGKLNTVAPWQLNEIEKIRAAGGMALVVDDAAKLPSFFSTYAS
jgi:hypothetical protein